MRLPPTTVRGIAALALVLAVAGCAAGPSQDSAAPAMAPIRASAKASQTAVATPPTAEASASRRAQQAPPDPAYVDRVPEPAGCLPVQPSIVGVKVFLVQQALGIDGHQERFDATTEAEVRSFQAGHGLPVDGVVGPRTWSALDTGYPYCVDRYTAQPSLARDASPGERIEAMIAYAEAQVGAPYIWGGAGPMGFDCSGLALQGMYAAGRTVEGLTTDLHVGADFRSTHVLFESSMARVPLDERRRGDLIFYGSPITHMAIYLGHDQIVESVRPAARVAAIYADGLPAQPFVLRPFPG